MRDILTFLPGMIDSASCCVVMTPSLSLLCAASCNGTCNDGVSPSSLSFLLSSSLSRVSSTQVLVDSHLERDHRGLMGYGVQNTDVTERSLLEGCPQKVISSAVSDEIMGCSEESPFLPIAALREMSAFNPASPQHTLHHGCI